MKNKSNQMPPVERVALTVPEAAQSLGVSERHLRSEISEVPHFYIGGRVLIPVRDLREWASSRVRQGQRDLQETVNEVLASVVEPNREVPR